MNKYRCFGNKKGQEAYGIYHDTEWGIPIHDDQKLFEILILEGAQAGLSFETILKKREGYRNAFYNFDIYKVANMNNDQLEKLLKNSSIVRNRLKIFSTRSNALAFLEIQKNFGSFNSYLWNFVQNKQKINYWKSIEEIPKSTLESDALSKDLKKYGMKFVGSKIIYAFMQAAGLVNDHIEKCWKYRK